MAKSVGVGVYLIEPGAVSSEFVNNAGIDPTAMIADAGAYSAPLAVYLQRTMSQFASSSAQTPEEVARIVVDTLQPAHAPFRSQTSDWAREFVAPKLADPDGSRITTVTASWVS